MAKKGLPALRPDHQELLADWERDAAQSAVAIAARAPAAVGSWISYKGKQFSMGGQLLTAPLKVVVLDFVYRYAKYEGDYDADNPRSPICWAIGEDERTLKPSDAAPKKQSETCATCWANKFGSGDGRGKACKNGIAMGLLEEDVQDPESATVALMSVPPTSLKTFGAFVAGVSRTLRVPPWHVTVEVGFDPTQAYPKFVFANVQPIDDAKLKVAVILARRTIRDALSQDFAQIEADEDSSKDKGGRREPARRKVERPQPAAQAGVPQRKKFGR